MCRLEVNALIKVIQKREKKCFCQFEAWGTFRVDNGDWNKNIMTLNISNWVWQFYIECEIVSIPCFWNKGSFKQHVFTRDNVEKWKGIFQQLLLFPILCKCFINVKAYSIKWKYVQELCTHTYTHAWLIDKWVQCEW